MAHLPEENLYKRLDRERIERSSSKSRTGVPFGFGDEAQFTEHKRQQRSRAREASFARKSKQLP
jgi:hypothetical protein